MAAHQTQDTVNETANSAKSAINFRALEDKKFNAETNGVRYPKYLKTKLC